jgi:hypothetical protein
MPASPNPLNYYIGKGKIYWTPEGGVERDVGNVPEIEYTPSTEKLEHKSSRTGVSSTDRTVVLEKAMTVRIVLEEFTAANIAMPMLDSEPVDNTDGTTTVRMLKDPEIKGALRFEGTNDVGQRVDILTPLVSFGPSGSFSPITDEWGQMEITGDVLVNEYTDGTSDFGTITVTDVS